MAVTVQQEVAALYSAVFNRAPDQEGLQFWNNAIQGGASLVQAAEGFALHPVFAETYAGMTDVQFVEQLYINVLGSAGDAKGIQFWVDKLGADISRGQVVAEFVQGSLSIDLAALLAAGELSQTEYDAAVIRQNTLTNKANVGIHFAETFGAASNLNPATDVTTKAGLESDPIYLASQAAIAKVTGDDFSVNAALARVDAAATAVDPAAALIAANDAAPAINTANLTASLAGLAAAEVALDNFLQGTALGDDPTTATVEKTVVGDVTNEVSATGTGAVSVFNTTYSASLDTLSTANARAAEYGTLRADAQASILNAQDGVTNAQAVVTATGTATAAEIAAYKAAISAESATAATVTATLLSLSDAELVFGSVSHENTTITADTSTWNGVVYGTSPADLIVASSTAGTFKVADAIVTAGTAANASDAAKLLLADAQSVLTAYQAAYNASKADGVAQTALDTATANLGDATAKTQVDALLTAQASLVTAKDHAATLETDIAGVESAYALNAQMSTLQGHVDDAAAAINDAGWNVVTLDGSVTALDTKGASGADLANDVFLFNGSQSTVANFGGDGTDLIKFSPGEYTLVNVAAADWASKAVGSSSALEIFVVDDGTNTTLHVEQNAFDGSTTAAQNNTVNIVLTGVTGHDFALSASGYLATV